MIGYSHLCDVLREKEIDVAHIDSSLTYRENCQLLKSQFGVVPRKVDYRLKYREAEGALQGALSREGMLAKANIPAKAEKPARVAKAKPIEPQRPGLPGPNLPGLPFDPIKRAREIESIVMKGEKRLYDSDKFRYQRFYGGIATAGSRGCNLKCLYCWNYDRNENPAGAGTYYSPREVRERLESIASRNDCDIARISGSENFLGMRSARHLYDVMNGSDLSYVIETNGVLLGYMPEILDLLNPLRNFRIRLSYKAQNGLQWEKLTGSNAYGFAYQQRAIKEIQARHIPLKVAIMPQFVDPKEVDISGYGMEYEDMRYYPGVAARLKKEGVKLRPKA